MSEMTDERAAEVLAAHNGWRRYNGETGVPGAPEMGDPAELGHAIDHAVSRLRSQPPAEAQAVAWEWEYIGGDHYPRGHKVARSLREMDPTNPPYPETWRPTRPLIYGDTAPSSAPVGVEGLVAMYREAFISERARNYRAEGMGVEQARIHAEADVNAAEAALTAALAGQQGDSHD